MKRPWAESAKWGCWLPIEQDDPDGQELLVVLKGGPLDGMCCQSKASGYPERIQFNTDEGGPEALYAIAKDKIDPETRELFYEDGQVTYHWVE